MEYLEDKSCAEIPDQSPVNRTLYLTVLEMGFLYVVLSRRTSFIPLLLYKLGSTVITNICVNYILCKRCAKWVIAQISMLTSNFGSIVNICTQISVFKRGSPSCPINFAKIGQNIKIAIYTGWPVKHVVFSGTLHKVTCPVYAALHM